MTTSRSTFCTFFVLIASLSFCQNSPPLPFDSFQEEIGLGSLQPSIAIPIFKKAVRGGRSIEFALRYNGVQWIVPPPSCTTCSTVWTSDTFFGWNHLALVGGVERGSESPYPCGADNRHIQQFEDAEFADSSGAAHQTFLTTYEANTCGLPTSASTTVNDGSGTSLL